MKPGISSRDESDRRDCVSAPDFLFIFESTSILAVKYPSGFFDAMRSGTLGRRWNFGVLEIRSSYLEARDDNANKHTNSREVECLAICLIRRGRKKSEKTERKKNESTRVKFSVRQFRQRRKISRREGLLARWTHLIKRLSRSTVLEFLSGTVISEAAGRSSFPRPASCFIAETAQTARELFSFSSCSEDYLEIGSGQPAGT